jgi:hypothetical protein
MTIECKHRDRLLFAMENNKDINGLLEAVDNFINYGHPNELNLSTANETQIGGDHYKEKSIQPWDYIAANELGYFEGNIVKYVSRWQNKGGVKDLQKARHYLDKLIELQHNTSTAQNHTITKDSK